MANQLDPDPRLIIQNSHSVNWCTTEQPAFRESALTAFRVHSQPAANFTGGCDPFSTARSRQKTLGRINGSLLVSPATGLRRAKFAKPFSGRGTGTQNALSSAGRMHIAPDSRHVQNLSGAPTGPRHLHRLVGSTHPPGLGTQPSPGSRHRGDAPQHARRRLPFTLGRA